MALQNLASRFLWRSLDLSATASLALTFSYRCTLGTVAIVLLYSGLSLAPLRTVLRSRFGGHWARIIQFGEGARETVITLL